MGCWRHTDFFKLRNSLFAYLPPLLTSKTPPGWNYCLPPSFSSIHTISLKFALLMVIYFPLSSQAFHLHYLILLTNDMPMSKLNYKSLSRRAVHQLVFVCLVGDREHNTQQILVGGGDQDSGVGRSWPYLLPQTHQNVQLHTGQLSLRMNCRLTDLIQMRI